MTERGTTGAGEPSQEFLEFIDPSSWMDVARLGTSAVVKPGLGIE